MPVSLVSVVVPAYNEVSSIAPTLREMCAYFRGKRLGFELIVAADGDDGTRELVAGMAEREPRLKIIGHRERCGKGRGIREAVGMALGDVIGFVDADNKSPITEFDKFEPYLNQGAEVVIGSRALPESEIERDQPWYRRYGSKLFGVSMHAIIGLDSIVDTQCGFKFFRRAAALDLFGRQKIDGYMFDVEILDLAQRAGYEIVQVPIRWRDDADSRLDLVRGNARNAVDLLRIRAGRVFAHRPVGRHFPEQVGRAAYSGPRKRG